MALVCKQEVGRRERLEQLQQSRRGLNANVLQVRRDVGYRDRQSREERV